MHEEVGGEESSNQDQDSVILSSKAVDAPEPGSPKDPAKKLCGYLNKLASKGPMRGFKPRWFVYDERKCYLYYFKTPQDALPLGHIEIGDASFSYDLEGDEGQFEIRTAGKEFILKASNRQVMHYWLQQLQQRRWEFSNSRGSGQRDSWLSPTFLPSTSGLVAKDPGTHTHTHTRIWAGVLFVIEYFLTDAVGEINEQLGMLMETIQAKDEVIIKLSQTPPPGLIYLYLLFQDILQGYKSQNKFLNKEILELTFLRRNAETREKTLEAKYSALEAKLCQVESKYLVLLQELRNPVCSASDQSPARDVISRLVEDALQVDNSDPAEQTIFKPHPVSEYDVFGFKTMPEEDDEEEKLVAKVRALDMRSLSLTDQEVSVGVKWENYLASTMNRDMVRCPELKALMRSGVPHAHRSKVWRWCVAFHTKKFRDILAPDYYETLLGVARDKPNPASKQIELDLLRTLPNNKHYSSPSADGIQKLRNVLLAFSWRNPDIGYCQGLNRLAAIALLYLDQEDAFWCLITIVEVFMPRDYYTKTLLGSQVDQRVFKDLLSEKLPRLHAHFDLYKVDSSLITFNWFLVLFVDSVNSDLLFKIWDSFLYEGPKIIFRFALALFKYKEEEFLKLQDSMAIFKYLRHFTRTILDWRKLMSMAFVDMNPFPLRQIQNRRTFHLEKVRLELTELDTIRQTFLRQRDTTPSDARTLGSDDDEEN
uniref:TBC1 domain family, member 2B n=1 Tax=Esox lucius TaxID=8010 RepID=A0AAY5KCZ7_ESOLU